MKLYLVYSRENLKNIFFNEKIMAPIYYEHSFLRYKINEYDINKQYIVLYKKVPKSALDKNVFVLCLEINLNTVNYIKNGNVYFVLDNIYLDQNNKNRVLKNIYYFSKELFHIFKEDIKPISEVKLFDKYKNRFKFLENKNALLTNDYDLKSYNFDYITNLDEFYRLQKEKNYYYDSLKGSLYLLCKFYPKCLVKNNNQLKYIQKIKSVETVRKRLMEENECNKRLKQKLISVTNKELKSYLKKLKSSIHNNRTHKSFKKKCVFNINLNRKISINNNLYFKDITDNEYLLINLIINIIVSNKINKDNENIDLLRKNIVKQLGRYSKNINDGNLYNDIRILYSVLINRNISISYKKIENNIIKFLYLVLEYQDNLRSLNSIIKENYFSKYYIIYLFLGAFLGFEKLSKVYTDNLKLNYFEEQLKSELENTINLLEQVYDIKFFYKKQNHMLIQQLMKVDNYYKLINKYCLYNRGIYDLNIKRKNENSLILNISFMEKKYKIYFNKNIIKEYENNFKRLNLNKKFKFSTVFSSFKYRLMNGKVVSGYDEIVLNEILNKLINELKGEK